MGLWDKDITQAVIQAVISGQVFMMVSWIRAKRDDKNAHFSRMFVMNSLLALEAVMCRKHLRSCIYLV